MVVGVWQCVMDGESYVRAAALTSLGCLSEVSRVWQHVTVTVGQVSRCSFLFICIQKYQVDTIGRPLDLFQNK